MVIQPKKSGQAFLDDVALAARQSDGFHLWWLGQSGFLLQWAGRHLLFDPYLSDSLTRKYDGTEKPHVRISERVIEPERLDFIDVVTSSHNHTDHLDGETLTALLAANPGLKIVVPKANLEFASQRLQVSADRLTTVDDGRATVAAGFQLHGIPAAHETIEHDDQGHCRCLGYVVQFGPWSIYHSGDTVLYDGLVERLTKWSIDVALLPINGRLPERGVAGNLWGNEAARLARDIRARVVIPCHFHMFEFNTVEPDECVQAAVELQQPCRVLELGERFSSTWLESQSAESTRTAPGPHG